MSNAKLMVAFALGCSLFVSGARADATAPDGTTAPGISAGSAASLDAATESDLRCAIVFMEMSSSQDVKMNTAGIIGAMYWVGRLDGRAPNLDLESRIKSEIPNMNPDVMQAERQRCGAEMQVRGKVLTEVGRDLVQQGEKALQEQKRF
jgi:hypothetical protein